MDAKLLVRAVAILHKLIFMMLFCPIKASLTVRKDIFQLTIKVGTAIAVSIYVNKKRQICLKLFLL